MSDTKTIRKLIKQDKLEDALMELEDIIDGTELLNELTLQYSRYSSLKKEVNHSTISMNDAYIQQNQIIKSVLSILSTIENENRQKSKEDRFSFDAIDFIKGATKGFLLEFGQLRLKEVEKIINLAVRLGAPQFNQGNIQNCLNVYLTTSKLIYEFIQMEGVLKEWDADSEMLLPLKNNDPKKGYDKYAFNLIKDDLRDTIDLITNEEEILSDKESAWKLRHSFDRTLLIINLSECFSSYKFWEDKSILIRIIENINKIFFIDRTNDEFSGSSFFSGAISYHYLIETIQKIVNTTLHQLSIMQARDHIFLFNEPVKEEYDKILNQMLRLPMDLKISNE